MDRRAFLISGLAAASAGWLDRHVWANSSSSAASSGRKRYNFVLILADDVGATDIGCYGNTEYKTPNLDKLAAEGTRFKTCWATPICSPSRAMIMTGKYAARTGWWHNSMRPYDWLGEPGGNLAESHTVFSEALKRYGYSTALCGKWQLSGVGNYPTTVYDHGFDEYCIHHEWINALPKEMKFDGFVSGPEHLWPGRTSGYWHPCIMQNAQLLPTKPDDYGPDIFCGYLIDFIRRHRDVPFLAYYPMQLAHVGADPACGARECYVPTPELDEHGNKTGKRTPEGFKYNVEYMDHLVGRVVKALDELGLRENTIVLFTGDNGSLGNKAQPTEAGCRVPMICNCPGTIPSGVVSDALIDFSDVLPTLLDFAGARMPDGESIDGRSFAPILRGEHNAAQREWIFSYYGYQRMLRDKRWYLDGNGRFYDCGDDRTGRFYKDVTDSQAPDVLAAKQRFEAILAKYPALPPEHPHRQRYEQEFVRDFAQRYKQHSEKTEQKQQ